MELAVANRIQREDLTFATADFRNLEAEGWWGFIAQLNRTAREVDRSRVQSARRAGFEPPHLESKLPEILAQG